MGIRIEKLPNQFPVVGKYKNLIGHPDVNKALQTKDGCDDFWKLFCEILFLKHSAAQGPWTKKRDGTIVYHDISMVMHQ